MYIADLIKLGTNFIENASFYTLNTFNPQSKIKFCRMNDVLRLSQLQIQIFIQDSPIPLVFMFGYTATNIKYK